MIVFVFVTYGMHFSYLNVTKVLSVYVYEYRDF